MKTPIILTLENKEEIKEFLNDLKAVTNAQEIKTGKFNIELTE